VVLEADAAAGHPPQVTAVGLTERGAALVEFYSNPTIAHGSSRPVRELRVVSETGVGPVVAEYPGPEIQLISDGDGFFVSSPLFSRTSQVVLEDVGFAIVDTEDYAISRFSSDGALRQVVRRSVERDMPPALIDEVIRERLRRTPRRLRGRGEEALRGQLVHVERPAVGRIISGGGGVLWVGAWRPSRGNEEAWTAYDTGGNVIGQLTIPGGYEVLDLTITRALLARVTDRPPAELRVYGLWWGT
jgi:hypothetical protein